MLSLGWIHTNANFSCVSHFYQAEVTGFVLVVVGGLTAGQLLISANQSRVICQAALTQLWKTMVACSNVYAEPTFYGFLNSSCDVPTLMSVEDVPAAEIRISFLKATHDHVDQLIRGIWGNWLRDCDWLLIYLWF